MENNKKWLTIGVVGIVVVGTLLWFISKQGGEKIVTPPEDSVACTQDVKLCPDGSYVQRVPPTCQFEACSNAPIDSGIKG